MEPGGVVALDAEEIALGRTCYGLGRGLRGLVERAFAGIFLEGLGGTRHNSRLPMIWQAGYLHGRLPEGRNGC